MSDTSEKIVESTAEKIENSYAEKNILILCMSTLNYIDVKHYYAEKTSNVYYRFEGVSQLEPGTKFFLNSLAAEKKKFDKIIVACSKEARNDIKKDEGKKDESEKDESKKEDYEIKLQIEKYNAKSAYDFYVKRIKYYIMGQEENGIKTFDRISDIDEEKMNTSIEGFFEEHHGKRDISYRELQENIERLSKDYLDDYTRDFDISDDYKNIENELLDEAESRDISACRELYEKQNIEGYIKNTRTKMTIGQYDYVIDSFMLRDKWLRYFYEKLEWRLKLKSEYIDGLNEKIESLEKQLKFLKNNMKKLISDYIELKSYQVALEKNALCGETILVEENLTKLYKNVDIERNLIEKVDLDGEAEEDIRKLRDAILESGKNDENVNVYMDMQGGARTFASMMNGIVTLLENKKFTFKNKISIAYNNKNIANEIIDETESYKIYDLISAMKSFINYGKADLLVGFFSEGLNRSEDKILKIIQNISDAIQICDSGRFDESIKILRKALIEDKIDIDNEEIQTKIENNYFNFVLGDIKKDYETLLDNPGILDKIEWCYKKGFTQQALTYIEDKIPEFLFKEKNIIRIGVSDENDDILNDEHIGDLRKFCGAPKYERKERIEFYYLPKLFIFDFFDMDDMWLKYSDLYKKWEDISENTQNNIINKYRQQNNGIIGNLIKKIYGGNPIEKVILRDNRDKARLCNIAQWNKDTLNDLLVDLIMSYEGNADDTTAFVLAYYELRFNSSDDFSYQGMTMTLENIIGLYIQDENLEKLYELNKKLLRILLLASPVMDDTLSQYKISETELGENITEQIIPEQIVKENAKQHLNEYHSIADDEFAKSYITFRLGKNEDTENFILRYASFPNEGDTEVECYNNNRELRLSEQRHTFKIGVDIKPEDKENFRFLLKLHGALKKERNNTNHALEGEDRLPLTIVNRAIKIYIDLCNKLFGEEW